MSTLTCKACDRMIPEYVAGHLTDEENLELIEHIKGCPECKEELTIQSMAAIWLDDIDDIMNINVDAQMDRQKKESLRKIYKADLKERMYLGALFGCVSILFLAVLLIVL